MIFSLSLFYQTSSVFWNIPMQYYTKLLVLHMRLHSGLLLSGHWANYNLFHAFLTLGGTLMPLGGGTSAPKGSRGSTLSSKVLIPLFIIRRNTSFFFSTHRAIGESLDIWKSKTSAWVKRREHSMNPFFTLKFPCWGSCYLTRPLWGTWE